MMVMDGKFSKNMVYIDDLMVDGKEIKFSDTFQHVARHCMGLLEDSDGILTFDETANVNVQKDTNINQD